MDDAIAVNRENLFLDSYDYTIVWSRVACVNWVYPLHILAAYSIVLSGILALLTRVVARYRKYHVWFGRAFLISMYWGYGTALLIRNAGLPYSTILFFTTKLVALCIGFLAIRRHKSLRDAETMRRVFATLKGNPKLLAKAGSMEVLFENERKIMESEKTTFASRYFTYKSLHGMLMAYAFANMLGRAANSNPAEFEGCWTQPALKSTEGAVQYVPRTDPEYRDSQADMMFFVSLFIAMCAIITGIGALYSWRAAKNARARAAEPQSAKSTPLSSVATDSSNSGSAAAAQVELETAERVSSQSTSGDDEDSNHAHVLEDSVSTVDSSFQPTNQENMNAEDSSYQPSSQNTRRVSRSHAWSDSSYITMRVA